MPPEFQAFASGFPLVLLHGAVCLALLAAGLAVYSLLSPHREVDEIREGNPAAAIAFAGAIAGLAIPLAAALAASSSTLEVALWGGSVVVIQLLAFRLIDMLLAGLPQRVREGETSAAWLLVSAKLAVALILAAAMTG
jgi:putative membrane protein